MIIAYGASSPAADMPRSDFRWCDMLLLLLGGQREHSSRYAVAFNAPSTSTPARALARPFNRIYDSPSCSAAIVEGIHLNMVPATARSRVDRIYIAPASGFRDREEYYDTCSAGKYVDRIQVPTAVIHAGDDPIIPATTYEHARFSSSCLVHIEKIGGHMGYLSARPTPFGTIRWQDYALDCALAELEKV